MIPRFLGLLAIVPMTVLLTISYFVLVTLNNVNGKRLKKFGYFIVALLWVASVVVLFVGIIVVFIPAFCRLPSLF